MTNEKFTEFKKDLKRLLKKHDASLGMEYEDKYVYITFPGGRYKEFILLEYCNELDKDCVCCGQCECKEW